MFEVRDMVRVKLLNEKRHFDGFERLFNTKICREDFFEKVLLEHRKSVKKLEVEYILRDNILEITYDDYSGYNVLDIPEYYRQEKVMFHGSFTKTLIRMVDEGQLLRREYIRGKPSRIIMEFSENIGEGYYKVDIINYLEDDGDFFFSIAKVFRDMVKEVNLSDYSIETGIRGLIIEFNLNLAQHGIRRKNKYIEFSGINLHSTVMVDMNFILIEVEKGFLWEDVCNALDFIRSTGVEEVICNIIGGDNKIKKKFSKLVSEMGMQVRFRRC